MKILIIVPAYNEEVNISGVINDLRENFQEGDILIVNDGSKDKTEFIAKGLGVKVLSLPYNLGIGGAMQAGYRYAKLYDYDIAVQFDGDGQHIASEIKKLISALIDNSVDLVVGSRFLNHKDYKPSFFRQIGISFFSFLLSIILGMRVTDTTSGFRAVNKRVINFFSDVCPDDYPEVEALVLLHKEGFKINEVGVNMKQRKGGRSSITPFKSVYYMIKVLLAVLIDLMKRSKGYGFN